MFHGWCSLLLLLYSIVRSVCVCVPLKKKFFDVGIKHTQRMSMSVYDEKTQKSVFRFILIFFIRLFWMYWFQVSHSFEYLDFFFVFIFMKSNDVIKLLCFNLCFFIRTKSNQTFQKRKTSVTQYQLVYLN